MTERIFRSAIDALVGRSLSLPASWLSTARFWPMTKLTIERLTLIGTSSVYVCPSPRCGRCLNALRISRPFGLDQDQEVRSAWGKSCIRLSRIFGATDSISNSRERFRAMSRIAASLTSGRTDEVKALSARRR